MCQNQCEINAKRELKMGGGTITQCLLCRRVSIEFGTTYLLFDESEFKHFACWFNQLDSTSPPAKNRFYIQIQGSAGVMLSLAPGEMRSLAELLKQGVRWLPEGSANAPPEPVAAVATGEWVH